MPIQVNYVTSINIMALEAAHKADKYKTVIGNAVKYLKVVPVGRGHREQDARQRLLRRGRLRGGKSRPDLSNTAFFLEALKSAGAPKNDPAFKKALVFVSRCQNFDSEHNKAAWAEKNNDGSFIYTGANGGENRRRAPTPRRDMAGYGSMTYAGIKSMIYCGVGKDDPRMKKALEWIKKNYTLDSQPRHAGGELPTRPLLLLPHLRQSAWTPSAWINSRTPRGLSTTGART